MSDVSKEDFFNTYWDEFISTKRKILTRTPRITNHAKYRLMQRFENKYTIHEIVKDIKKWWKTIKSYWDGTFVVKWSLWCKYIINKFMVVITII